MIETLGRAVALLGAVLTLLSAIGVVRFPDVLTRTHALTKASTAGFCCVAVGAAVTLSSTNDVTSVLLAAGIQLLTIPVAANLVNRAIHRAGRSRPDEVRGPRTTP